MTVEDAVLAAGFSCPAVHDERSFYVARGYAETHPPARPYVIKMSATLGLVAQLPEWPEVAGTVVNVGRVSCVITAAGGLADQRTGSPVGAPPPSRRQRREQRAAPVITDAVDLMIAIRKNPTDPTERRALVQVAVDADRLRWIPDSWPEKPTEAYPLQPGAAEMIQRAAYGRTSAEADQIARERVRGTR